MTNISECSKKQQSYNSISLGSLVILGAVPLNIVFYTAMHSLQKQNTYSEVASRPDVACG